ncbi:type II toxin-antitoxin system RelE/ParE family toxin [Pedobacter sp. BS3]|uniref:type II toxin-antitoxin system RelE/ParE family toxin n=1 Tax=Pedobacter sp. BS3 TaxID=2567937 RepID=UPI0011EFBDD3|nr:type II toxin-antitoxin system RelE/ParE family toxin [Pedobacter sp. BS3]
MVEKIIWSSRASKEFIEILQYGVNRNKSKTYSLKLNSLINVQLNLILKFPKIGKKTDLPNVYVKVIKDYLLYYEIVENSLYILTIRDGRRNPQTLKIK